MYRTLRSTRLAEDYNTNVGSPSSKNPGLRVSLSTEDLPVCDPVSEMAKNERSRLKLAESAVHVIPLVLLLCAVILWVFSSPEVDVGMKHKSAEARMKGWTIEGDAIDKIIPTKPLPNSKLEELGRSRSQLSITKASVGPTPKPNQTSPLKIHNYLSSPN